MKTQNLRLNVQPLANYVCKVQFAWQAKNKIKTNSKQYLHVEEHRESSLEMAQEIPVELWDVFSQPPFILKLSNFQKKNTKFTIFVI